MCPHTLFSQAQSHTHTHTHTHTHMYIYTTFTAVVQCTITVKKVGYKMVFPVAY